MSVLIPKSASFFFSSDSANQAQNVSADGSQFTVVLNSPLALPKGAMAATLSVSQANIWNTSYNISAAFGNNVFRFRSANNEHTIIFPDGLLNYSLSGFNSYLSTQFANLGLSSNLLSVGGDDATQRAIITFVNAGDQVDFTVANSVREILGFNARVVVATIAGFNALRRARKFQ